jgi:hypothetical protein
MNIEAFSRDIKKIISRVVVINTINGRIVAVDLDVIYRIEAIKYGEDWYELDIYFNAEKSTDEYCACKYSVEIKEVNRLINAWKKYKK